MIFTLFTTIVFIAEIIIAFAIIACLVEIDKKINYKNRYLFAISPKIKIIAQLFNKISSQVLELIPEWLEKASKKRDDFIINFLKNFVISTLFWGLNIKIIKKMKRMKFLRAALKGFAFMQNMI